MFSREEIAIRLGIDSKAMSKGLSTAGAQIKRFASNVGVQLAAAFSFGAIIAQIKSTIDYVEKLSNTAGSLNVSNAFLQDVTNIGIAAGKSQEKMERLLTIFAKGLSPGQDLETEFMEFLDKIAATKDPAERLAKAFDRVGKSGKDLLDVARDGSVAFKELAATFAKLSDTDIEAINRLDAAFDGLWNRVKIGTGNAIGYLDKFFRALKNYGADGRFPGQSLGFIYDTLEQEDKIAASNKRADAKERKREQDKKPFTTIPGIIEGPVQPEHDKRYRGREFSMAQPRKFGIDNYMSKIKSGQDAYNYKAKTAYEKFGKAIAEAQKKVPTEFVQKVSIVEIKE